MAIRSYKIEGFQPLLVSQKFTVLNFLFIIRSIQVKIGDRSKIRGSIGCIQAAISFNLQRLWASTLSSLPADRLEILNNRAKEN